MKPSQDSSARRFFGKYPGIVLKNTAAGAHRGIIAVELTGLVEDVPDGEGQRPMQVQALPCLPPGLFHVPAVGAHVWVEFAAGDIDHPIWVGVWYAEGDETPGVEGEAGRLCLSDGQGNRVILGEDGLTLRSSVGSWSVSLDALLSWLTSHQHTAPSSSGPTTPGIHDELALSAFIDWKRSETP